MTDMLEVRQESIKEILGEIGANKAYNTVVRAKDNSVIIDNEVVKEMIVKFMKNFGNYIQLDPNK